MVSEEERSGVEVEFEEVVVVLEDVELENVVLVKLEVGVEHNSVEEESVVEDAVEEVLEAEKSSVAEASEAEPCVHSDGNPLRYPFGQNLVVGAFSEAGVEVA